MSGPPAGKDRKSPPRSIQQQLDEALADSFPASDPVSLVTSQTEEDWGNGTDEEQRSQNGEPGAKSTEP